MLYVHENIQEDNKLVEDHSGTYKYQEPFVGASGTKRRSNFTDIQNIIREKQILIQTNQIAWSEQMDNMLKKLSNEFGNKYHIIASKMKIDKNAVRNRVIHLKKKRKEARDKKKSIDADTKKPGIFSRIFGRPTKDVIATPTN